MLKCTLRQKFRNLLWGTLLAPWLFYPPLSAQGTHKKAPINLEFAIGAKTTLAAGPTLLKDLTHTNLSRGGFVESRLSIPLGWVRARVALDDWGRNNYSGDYRYWSEVSLLRGTVGLQYFSSINAAADFYWCVEFGINHWNINSAHPLFEKEKYNRIAIGFCFGIQTEHLFLEFSPEIHSMDNKGIKRDFWLEGLPGSLPLPAMPIKRERSSVGVGLSFIAGWKF
jgi:hypothetical protein